MSTEEIVAALKALDTKDNVIDVLDKNFLGEFLKLNFTAGPTDPLDHIGARKWLEEVYKPMPKAPKPTKLVRDVVEVKIEDVPVVYGEDKATFNIRVYTPQFESEEARPALLGYHGGGWIHGHSSLEDEAFSFIASETRAVVFGVDYRLAPEDPFPAPHNDSYEALNYVVANAAKYNVDTSRVALWGCSAGGNLVAGVALRDAREHETTRICHASLIVPALCPPSVAPEVLGVPTASYPFFTPLAKANPFILTKAEETWETFSNGPSNLSNHYVAPLLADPVPNHCPLHVVVAGVDVLRDEGIVYAMKYRDAGIDVQLEIVPGAPHGLLAANEAWVSKQYWRSQARVLNVALHTKF